MPELFRLLSLPRAIISCGTATISVSTEVKDPILEQDFRRPEGGRGNKCRYLMNQYFHDQSGDRNYIWKWYKNKKNRSPCKKYNLFLKNRDPHEYPWISFFFFKWNSRTRVLIYHQHLANLMHISPSVSAYLLAGLTLDKLPISKCPIAVE